MASLHAPISIAYSKRKKVAPQLSGERKFNKIKVASGKAYLQVYENEAKINTKRKEISAMSNLFSFVTSAGLKPAISGTGILHSIQLNYEAVTSFAYCLFYKELRCGH